jgi:ankyrin repeat protein
MKSTSVLFLFVAVFCCPTFSGEIHDAVREGDFGLVMTLVEQDAANLNAKNGKGKTPLDFARKFHHPKIAEWLVSRGAKQAGSIDGIIQAMLGMAANSDDEYVE